MLFSDLGIISDLHYPVYFSIFSPTSMHHFYNRWPLSPATNTSRSRLFKTAKSGGCTGGSYPSPLQWRPFFQKRPGFRSVFSPDGSRAHPACCPCRAWWGFPWAWTCLSRHCILLCKVEGGHREGGLASPGRSHSMSLFKGPPQICVVSFRFDLPVYTLGLAVFVLFSLFSGPNLCIWCLYEKQDCWIACHKNLVSYLFF